MITSHLKMRNFNIDYNSKAFCDNLYLENKNNFSKYRRCLVFRHMMLTTIKAMNIVPSAVKKPVYTTEKLTRPGLAYGPHSLLVRIRVSFWFAIDVYGPKP